VREQKGGGEIEEERRGSTKAGETELATTSSVTKEATTASAGDNGACSNGENLENKCSGGKRSRSRSGTEYRGSS